MRAIICLMVLCAARSAPAQTPPPIRQIGRLERVTTDALASVASVVSLSGGRVLVHDRVARRVALYDSTLAHPTVIADTTAGTANAYGQRPGSLIRYRGDTALFIDQSSLSMFVIAPSGTIGRVMAIPRAGEAQELIARAGIDARGRIIYSMGLGSMPGAVMLGSGDAVFTAGKPTALARFNAHLDSAFLVRVDPGTRVLDSVVALRIPKLNRELKTDANGGLTAIETTPDPLPLIDAWATMDDGTIAVLRARDYHVDWIGTDGKVTSSPKMPFDWQRVSDERKQTLIDSAVTVWQRTYDQIMNNGGRGGAPPAQPGTSTLAPMLAIRAPLNALPDYLPPIVMRPGGFLADAEGNLWIRTTTMVQGQPVYDIVNRRGELADRVQLPSFRVIAGFGPGVVYMAVQESSGVVHLERARIK